MFLFVCLFVCAQRNRIIRVRTVSVADLQKFVSFPLTDMRTKKNRHLHKDVSYVKHVKITDILLRKTFIIEMIVLIPHLPPG